jgi:large subunit ribosomal protein L9
MKVILKEEHETLGAKGDVVEVKNGYGRNFLIPRQLAVVATKSSLKQYAEERKQASHKLAAARQQLEALAARLSGTDVTVTARTGEDNRLFGTITGQQVVDALAEKGFTVDRRKLSLGEIRTTGTYPATIRLAADVTAEVQVTVVPEGAAADDADTDETEA